MKMTRASSRALNASLFLALMPLLLGLQQNNAHGEVLYNGANASGTVAQFGENRYTFDVTQGDYLTLTAIKTSSTSRQPAIKLYAPNGSSTTSIVPSSQTALLTNRAIMSGTYTAAVYTTSPSGGDFDYVLRLAQLTRPYIVPTGDEGGSLTNGDPRTGTGTLLKGDLDLWSFVANAGDYVALRAGVDSNWPLQVDVRCPNGELLSSSGGAGIDCLIEIPSASAGTYVLSVMAKDIPNTDVPYRLNLARMPGNPVSAGTLINGVTSGAMLSPGDLDQWILYACKSSVINLRCEAQGSAEYYPRIQVFAQDGRLLGETSPNWLRVKTLSLRAPYSGRYTVLIQSLTLGGKGPYLLSGAGIAADGMTVCPPLINGENLEIGALRGIPDAQCVLLSTTNIMDPMVKWDVMATVQFDDGGGFGIRIPFNHTEPQRYFRLRTP